MKTWSYLWSESWRYSLLRTCHRIVGTILHAEVYLPWPPFWFCWEIDIKRKVKTNYCDKRKHSGNSQILGVGIYFWSSYYLHGVFWYMRTRNIQSKGINRQGEGRDWCSLEYWQRAEAFTSKRDIYIVDEELHHTDNLFLGVAHFIFSHTAWNVCIVTIRVAFVVIKRFKVEVSMF